MVLVYHDVRAPPKDYNRLDRHSRTVSFVHSHVRSSLAYIFSGAAQGLQSGDRQYFGRRPSLTSLQFTVIRRLLNSDFRLP